MEITPATEPDSAGLYKHIYFVGNLPREPPAQLFRTLPQGHSTVDQVERYGRRDTRFQAISERGKDFIVYIGPQTATITSPDSATAEEINRLVIEYVEARGHQKL